MVLQFGGAEVSCVFRERITARPGESISINIDADHVHLFDEQTGMRLTA